MISVFFLQWLLIKTPHPKKLTKEQHLRPNSNVSNWYARSFFYASQWQPHLYLISHINNSNFHSWSRAVKLALRSKKKLGFVDGILIRPNPYDSKYLAWDRYNNIVMAWLTNSIDKEIPENVYGWIRQKKSGINYTSATIKATYFASLTYKKKYTQKHDEQTITQYFTTLKKLWQEFDNFRPIPNCVCNPIIHYELPSTIKTYHDNDYIIRFLKGNGCYAPVRTQIMLMTLLPSVNKSVFTPHSARKINHSTSCWWQNSCLHQQIVPEMMFTWKSLQNSLLQQN